MEFTKFTEWAVANAPMWDERRYMTLDQCIAWANGWNPEDGTWGDRRYPGE